MICQVFLITSPRAPRKGCTGAKTLSPHTHEDRFKYTTHTTHRYTGTQTHTHHNKQPSHLALAPHSYVRCVCHYLYTRLLVHPGQVVVAGAIVDGVAGRRGGGLGGAVFVQLVPIVTCQGQTGMSGSSGQASTIPTSQRTLTPASQHLCPGTLTRSSKPAPFPQPLLARNPL